ncbi:MAG: S1 RNA-binding domain-containing protein [Lachnospiraceae bacterium]|nr:S1 RNA-binding domain-containing protein [Lachnospiraceae bacterium]
MVPSMDDMAKELEASYAYMGNGEYDTDTLLAWEKINGYLESGEIITVVVDGIVNKGVTATVEGVKAFIPVSRLAATHVEDTLPYLEKEIRVRVIEADMESEKLVLSAREILREETAAARKSQRELALSKLNVGDVVEGEVVSMQNYGAFIDLGDEVNGLVHISEISDRRIKSPKEVLEIGQKVKAKIIAVNEGKISLSIKELIEEQRIREEEEIMKNRPEEESFGSSLGSLLKGIKLD